MGAGARGGPAPARPPGGGGGGSGGGGGGAGRAVEAVAQAAVDVLAHREEPVLEQGRQGAEDPGPLDGLGGGEARGRLGEAAGGGQRPLGLALDRNAAGARGVLVAALAGARGGRGGRRGRGRGGGGRRPAQVAPPQGVAERPLAHPHGGGRGA